MVVKTDETERAIRASQATRTMAERPAVTRNFVATRRKRTVNAPSGKNAHAATPARASSVVRLSLQALIDEFLYEIDETLAAGTYRAYSVPLSLFLRHLCETLGREPLLADLNVEAVRAWSQMLPGEIEAVVWRAGRGRYTDRPLIPAQLPSPLARLRQLAHKATPSLSGRLATAALQTAAWGRNSESSGRA